MIVGITGVICTGKQAMSQHLTQTHGFEAINVMEIFKLRLIKQRREARSRRDARVARIEKAREKAKNKQLTPEKDGSSDQSAPEEESKHEEAIEDSQLDVDDRELGLVPGDGGVFCHAYFMADYSQLRKIIIKEVFRDLTSKWNRHFVVYPLSPCDDIQLML